MERTLSADLAVMGMRWSRVRIAAMVLVLTAAWPRVAASELSAEQSSVLATVRDYALQYTNKLPDYICTQVTHRTVSKMPTSSWLVSMSNPDTKGTPTTDVVEERLSYVGRRETYEVLAVNGKPSTGTNHLQFAGVVSVGEFGSLIHQIFAPTTKTTFTWKQKATLQKRSVYVLAYTVPAEAGFRVNAALANRDFMAPYDGLIYVDAQTKAIARITVSVHLPFNFPIRLIRQVVDYNPVTIAGMSYSLPSHAEVRVQDDSSEYTNKIDFKDYHKFGTESTILTANLQPAIASGDVQGLSTAPGIAETSANKSPVGGSVAQPQPDSALAVADPQPAATALRENGEKSGQSARVASQRTMAEAIAVSPPQPPPADTITTPEAPRPTNASGESFRLQLSADLVIVPVVVRDAHGHAVGNLTSDAFQLFDKGVRRNITSFTVEVQEGFKADEGLPLATPRAVSGKAATLAAAENFAVYLLDDKNLNAGQLAQVKEAAARQFDRLQPADRTAILTTSGVEIAGFTADREQLREALKKIRPLSGKVLRCPQMSYYMADQMLNVYSSLIPASNPPLQAATAEVERCMMLSGSEAARRALATARQVVVEGEFESRGALQTLRNAVRWLAGTPGKRSIILVSPGFYLSSNLQLDAAEVIDDAIRAEVIISALDARGLYTVNADGETAGGTGGEMAARIKHDLARNEAVTASVVMEEMAAGTGGNFIHNTNDLKGSLQGLATPPEFTYLLGFKPEGVKKDGSFHPLKVQVSTTEKLKLQARRGYFAAKRY